MTVSNPTPNDTRSEINTPGGLKDSGKRRSFESGAVRDISKGKGRFDLVPLDVIAGISTLDGDYTEILKFINVFILTKDTTALYTALSVFNVDYNSLLSLAIHFENGAIKYGEYNWQKGISIRSYIDSAVRHLTKYYAHISDEPHDIAFIWNIVACIWTMRNKPECWDFPEYK